MSKEGKKVDRGMISVGKIEDKEILPGFRFHPTDEELVAFYLRRKVENRPVATELIKQIDIYKYDPWDLPILFFWGEMSNMEEKEWYFFCLRGRKYKNSVRPNRVTGSGFWKATGIDRPISSLAGDTNQCIGLKKSLVYYRGSAGKGTKTDWVMHEFRLPSCTKTRNPPIISTQEAEIWTICRIFKRTVSYNKSTQKLRKASLTRGPSTQPSSTTWTSESKDLRIENSGYFGPYTFQPNEMDQSEERYGTLCDTVSSIAHQAPLVASHSSFLGSNFGALYELGKFDELRAVVDGAISPNPYAFGDAIRRY